MRDIELDTFRGRPRIWFFFTQSHDRETIVIRSCLRTVGRELDIIPDLAGYRGEQETGGNLFDLSDPGLLQTATAESFSLIVEDTRR